MIKFNLAVLLAERNLKIADVVKKTGISKTTLRALFHNIGKGIQFETLDTLCEFLNVSPGDLISHYNFDITDVHIKGPVDNRPGTYVFECTFKIEKAVFSGEILCDLRDDPNDEGKKRIIIVIWEKLYNQLMIIPNRYIADFFIECYHDLFPDIDDIGAEFGLYKNKEDMWLTVNLEEPKEDS